MVYTEVLVEAFIRDRWALILSELVECLCIPLFGWSGSLSLSPSLYSFTFQPDFSSSSFRVCCLKIHIEYHWSKYKTESKEKKWSRERPRLAQSLVLHRRGVYRRIEKVCEVFWTDPTLSHKQAPQHQISFVLLFTSTFLDTRVLHWPPQHKTTKQQDLSTSCITD